MPRYFQDAPDAGVFTAWYAMRAAKPGNGSHGHGAIAAEAHEIMRLARDARRAKEVICNGPDRAVTRAVRRRSRAVAAIEAIVASRLGVGWFVEVDGFALLVQTYAPSGAVADSQWIPGRK